MKTTPMLTKILIPAVSALLTITAFGETIASGTLADKSGDSDMDDLMSATITVNNDSTATFEVRFRKSTFKPGFSGVQFCLDLDQNVKTGDSSGRFGKILGLETAVNLPDYDNDFSETVFFEDDGDFLRGGHYPFTTLDDGYRLTVPLKALRATKPTMNFTVTSSQALSSESSTAILDQIPDQGDPVGKVTLTPRVAGVDRIWTDAKTGRTLEGSLQSKSEDGSEVKVQRKDNGKVVILKSESLVEADREFIKSGIDHEEVSFLDDLKEIDARGSRYPVAKHGQSHEGFPILVNGVKPAHSLLTHPPSSGSVFVTYNLDGQFSEFAGTATIADCPAKQSLRFRIIGDGKALWLSNIIRNGKDAQEFRVSVRGVAKMELEVECKGKLDWAWATWVSPRLSKAAGRVQAGRNDAAEQQQSVAESKGIIRGRKGGLFPRHREARAAS